LPGPGQVRVKVEACGVCHSDIFVKDGLWPGLQYPRVPGHLGVQYARKMGFKTVALGRGKDIEPLAKQLGAHHYVDSSAVDTVAELQKLGGARVILATAPSAKAISDVVGGLGVNGNLLIPAAPNDPLTVSMFPLIMGRRQISGWYSGTARDSQDALEFSALRDVHPMIEKFPFSRVADAYERMIGGKVRFRAVLMMENEQPIVAQQIRDLLGSSIDAARKLPIRRWAAFRCS
jgi:D-arabinose 1-dehydrogenase-like Zn-dependent alcohol dehydrogenase